MDKTPPLSCPQVALVVEQMWQPVPGGSGTYIVELVRELKASGIKVAGISARHRDSGSAALEVGLENLPIRQSVLPRTVLYEAWNRLGRPKAESLLPGCDVVHATTWAIPGTDCPTVVTVHDLAFLRAPEHFTKRGNHYFRRCLEQAKRQADAVIVPSQATADDCLAEGFSSDSLHVIPHGVKILPATAAEKAQFCADYGIARPYVLWTGTREPRKNLPTLLQAFARIVRERDDLDLVLVGPLGWGDDTQESELVASIPADRIHILGRLSWKELNTAYAAAQVFCFPSIWEGFGLPVLEAMAHGVPVVTSAGTSMEEICGSDALLIDPTSPAQLAEAIEAASSTDRADLAAAGPRRAEKFTWAASAAAHAQVYRQVTQ